METTVSERLKSFVAYKGMSIRAFERSCNLSNGYVNGIETTIMPHKLSSIRLQYPELNTEWLLYGEGDMLKEERQEIEISYTEGVPYYDVDFQAGFDVMASPDHNNPEYLIKFPKYERATLWCHASGDSMEPEINNGDTIALQKVDDFRFLPYDGIYAIVTTNDMRTIKRIGKGETPNSYRLIPTNKAYQEQDLPIEMISQVFKVLGCVKRF